MLHTLPRLDVDICVWHGYAFDGGLVAGAMRAAAKQGVYPILAAGAAGSERMAVHNIERIIAGGVFGTVVVTPSRALERRIRERYWHDYPVVVVFPENLSAWPTNAVDADNEAMGRRVAELLAVNGSKRWAVIGTTNESEAERARRRGFRAAARELGATVKDVRVPRGDAAHAQRVLVPRLRRDRRDGIFGVMASASFGALLACLELGMNPGRDVHVVGCDCVLWQSHDLPTLTSVEILWPDVGAAAVQSLLELRESRARRVDNLLIRPHVVPGDTCPVPAAAQRAIG